MKASAPPPSNPAYAVAEKTLARWARERLRRRPGPAGGVIYIFAMSGSTCTNMGLPIEAEMTVHVDATGRVTATALQPAAADPGPQAMCAAAVDPGRFFTEIATRTEAVGLTLDEAAFRDWSVEVSGCLCTAGHRRHKWRNAFQTIHFAITHSVPEDSHESTPR